jgi:hypothetical protein
VKAVVVRHKKGCGVDAADLAVGGAVVVILMSPVWLQNSTALRLR